MVLIGLKEGQADANRIEYLEKELSTKQTSIKNKDGKERDRIHWAFYITGDKETFTKAIAVRQVARHRHDYMAA
jgi:hypothetical protein